MVPNLELVYSWSWAAKAVLGIWVLFSTLEGYQWLRYWCCKHKSVFYKFKHLLQVQLVWDGAVSRPRLNVRMAWNKLEWPWKSQWYSYYCSSCSKHRWVLETIWSKIPCNRWQILNCNQMEYVRSHPPRTVLSCDWHDPQGSNRDELHRWIRHHLSWQTSQLQCHLPRSWVDDSLGIWVMDFWSWQSQLWRQTNLEQKIKLQRNLQLVRFKPLKFHGSQLLVDLQFWIGR